MHVWCTFIGVCRFTYVWAHVHVCAHVCLYMRNLKANLLRQSLSLSPEFVNCTHFSYPALPEILSSMLEWWAPSTNVLLLFKFWYSALMLIGQTIHSQVQVSSTKHNFNVQTFTEKKMSIVFKPQLCLWQRLEPEDEKKCPKFHYMFS